MSRMITSLLPLPSRDGLPRSSSGQWAWHHDQAEAERSPGGPVIKFMYNDKTEIEGDANLTD